MDLNRETLLRLYTTMSTIRNFEERGIPETGQRAMSASVHSSAGQEAVPTGICAHLTDDDYIGSTHRGHGHCIAKGVDPKTMMAELFGRSTGNNKGKGGSMHIADMSKGMLGTNGVVAASVPLAVGAGLTSKLKNLGRVAVAFFGDGGANQGVLHESMNLASVWKLPVIFCCENNGYAESTPVEYALSTANVSDRAAGYDMPGINVDGMDVFAVYDAAGQAVARARAGEGPSLLECRTYRFYGHTVFDNPLSYRTKEEEDHWRARDPLKLFREAVLPLGEITQEELDQIDQEAAQLMEDAIKFADESPLPNQEEIYDDVYVSYPTELLKRGTNMEI
ncbi:MAG: pyruvate dehydrogenase (acetyl-transferring) E1 component subunit alpha [Chloroflexi bacterium]|jgi:pyruvate dehydrogenase E1 component alpha subunit|nr:pyruvate dehydrogenase (acetyl-transferring) E1 component subunit alpha [Chloroflexota bacterium]MCH2538060.1 thiamine pyrophosphate-dependent dehydrogenase E1 component subunit alpha [Dehalococcoidia bacterium]MEE2928676.1 thiamine pyrophosphate-dependent dehydrogenase E1 component subunit alpha [Chloroflexota bacterium]HIB10526.1 thiamine pyrophosphate-dependent dehydrogenase E1 component subunit alpha [Dehalococcoidia bacterium]HIM49182.1 thiamine pyrophosphate-dependent dehydrogenase E1 |tara:strand:- start:1033 stop:2040 length:1008 start_codon:yes stop_codon:yes gene_type:complete